MNMEYRYVNPGKVVSLEDYAMTLVIGLISLQTLTKFHEQAIKQGILKEDQECRGNTILWDFHRLMRLYKDQFDSVAELLPPDFSFPSLIEKLQKQELTQARKVLKKK